MNLTSLKKLFAIVPYTLKPVYTARKPEEKKAQQLFLQYYLRENFTTIRTLLLKLNRPDLLKKLFGVKG